MKLLSVAVPCYNSAAYMRRCVDSLLPGGEEVEILIIDDGSADETLSIARAYEQEHPGVVRAIPSKERRTRRRHQHRPAPRLRPLLQGGGFRRLGGRRRAGQGA